MMKYITYVLLSTGTSNWISATTL